MNELLKEILPIIVSGLLGSAPFLYYRMSERRKKEAEADHSIATAAGESIDTARELMAELRTQVKELKIEQDLLKEKINNQNDKIDLQNRKIGAYNRNQTMLIKFIKSYIKQMENNGITPKPMFDESALEKV